MLESDSVRYLFVPVEGAYLVLVTDKCSNIISDSETLRVFQQIVGDICPGTVSPDRVAEHSFEILFAIDELISISGNREVVNFSQIKEYLLMESSEEKLQNLIRFSKEQEENQRRRKKAQELDKEKIKRIEAEKQMMKMSARLQTHPSDDATPSSNLMLGGSTIIAENPATGSIIRDLPSTSQAASHAATGGPRKGMALGKKRVAA